MARDLPAITSDWTRTPGACRRTDGRSGSLRWRRGARRFSGSGAGSALPPQASGGGSVRRVPTGSSCCTSASTTWELRLRRDRAQFRPSVALLNAKYSLHEIDDVEAFTGCWRFAGRVYERERPRLVSLHELGDALDEGAGDPADGGDSALGGYLPTEIARGLGNLARWVSDRLNELRAELERLSLRAGGRGRILGRPDRKSPAKRSFSERLSWARAEPHASVPGARRP
jgi:hypothetical protein